MASETPQAKHQAPIRLKLTRSYWHQALTVLVHPYVISVVGIVLSDEPMLLVEYATQGTLKAFLHPARLSQTFVGGIWALLMEVCCFDHWVCVETLPAVLIYAGRYA